jgi:hypothetical protein
MSFLTKSLQKAIQNSLSLLSGEFLLVTGLFLVFLRDSVASWMQDNQAKYWLANSIVFLISITIVLFSYILILHYKHRLKFSLGAYWDKELNPYCPSCKKPLSNYGLYSAGRKNYPGLKCIECKEVIRLSDGNKICLTIEGAQEIVKKLFNN